MRVKGPHPDLHLQVEQAINSSGVDRRWFISMTLSVASAACLVVSYFTNSSVSGVGSLRPLPLCHNTIIARRSLWAAARVSLPLQWHHALLWLTADKVRSRCRSHNSQVWLKKTVSTCIRLWSLCHCRCHWSAWKKRKKKPHKHNRACGYWPHLSMLTLAAALVTFETISRDHIMLLMHLFQAACGEPGSGVEP